MPRRRGLVWLLDGGPMDPVAAHESWVRQFSHPLGVFGYPWHVGLAVIACFAVAGPVSFVELAPFGLLVCWVLRVPFVWRGLAACARMPVVIAATLWIGWLLLSLLWTRDVSAGWHEAAYARWMWVPVALWPVMDRRRWLIGAMCVGFACAHIAQIAEYIALRQGVTLFWHPQSPDPMQRISGWWQQPAMGGVMCAVSLGLHIGPALMGAGWRRWIGLAGSVVAGVCLVMTGTRGAMLAAGVLVLIAACVAGWKLLRGDRNVAGAEGRGRTGGGKRVFVSVCVMAALALVMWLIAAKTITGRLGAAREEVTRIVRTDDVDSDIGGRVIAARAALDAFARAPIRGGGAGSFQDSARRYVREQGIAIQDWRLEKLKTAHNTPLHAAATTGVVGGLLLLSVYALGLWGAGRGRIGAWEWCEELGTYSAAPLLGLLALLLCGAFETIYTNMNSQAMVCVLIGLSMVVRPRARGAEARAA